MAFTIESGMSLLTVSNKNSKPQDEFPFKTKVGVDEDGETIREFNMDLEFKDTYFVCFFFPMDFKVDSSEVLAFKENLEEFSKMHCKIVGVTSDSPFAIKRWISKGVSGGGFGGPVGFPILCDADLSLAMSLGAARDCGMPARATFIVDWKGIIRYVLMHRSDIGRPVKEILRMTQAFRHSDLAAIALPSGWVPGVEGIPTDFSEKVKYFIYKFGHGEEGEREQVSASSTSFKSAPSTSSVKSGSVQAVKSSVARRSSKLRKPEIVSTGKISSLASGESFGKTKK